MRTDGTMSWYKDGGALASRPSHSPPAHHGHTFSRFFLNDSKYLTSSKETLLIVEQGRYCEAQAKVRQGRARDGP